jgi:hypothetical protein
MNEDIARSAALVQLLAGRWTLAVLADCRKVAAATKTYTMLWTASPSKFSPTRCDERSGTV